MNVVIVGRPNVGKSSLFNRLLGRRRSLVLDTPGVTRDRIKESVQWWVHANPILVHLIDTGGLGHELFRHEIARQVKTALDVSDVVLFVMDIRAGLTNDDRSVLQELRRSGLKDRAPIIAVLNKADSDRVEDEMMHEFYALGIENMIAISAEHGLGIDDLKDMIVDLYDESRQESSLVDEDEEAWEQSESDETSSEEASFFSDEDFAEENEEEGDESADLRDSADLIDSRVVSQNDAEKADEQEEKNYQAYTPPIPSIAIVGQPNVGKSTLLNAICGEDRSIVSPIAGTTVDAIDTKVVWNDQEFLFVDTAGIRRKNKTEQGVEVLSVVQTRKALERASLAILMIDAEKGVYDQDEKIAGMIEEAGCSVIMVLNKWDTQVNNKEFSQKKAEEQLRGQIRFLGYAPLVFTTAKDGIGLDRLYRLIQAVLEQRTLKLSTKEVTEFIRREVEIQNPDNAKFYFVLQASRNPPTFVAHVSDPNKIHFSMTRHLIKAIRERWGYLGTPIRLLLTKAKNRSEK
jgi:GTP-binding protein